ncbi:MAG: hypothetical protein JNM85_11325 [Chthonomonas sp.]|nr:hypothetical protein [Chthonomonas sp.]
MQKLFSILVGTILLGSVLGVAGCAKDANPAEDVNAQIQALPAEERFQMIKNDTVLTLEQKDIAVDNLPITDQQKTDYKAKLREAAPAGASTAAPGQR